MHALLMDKDSVIMTIPSQKKHARQTERRVWGMRYRLKQGIMTRTVRKVLASDSM